MFESSLATAEARLQDTSDPAREDAILAELPVAVRDAWLLNWLDFEYNLGSLLGYFDSAHGRHAPEAIAALRRIGADELADVLARAKRVGPIARQRRLERLSDRYAEVERRTSWGELFDRHHEAQA